MNKQHYDCIMTTFELDSYSSVWYEDYSRLDVSQLEIGQNVRTELFYIFCPDLGCDIVSHLPSEQIAQDIIRYIKETEVLFI